MLTLTMGAVTMLSIREVAEALDVSVMTIRRLVWRGELAAFKIGGQLKFDEAAVTAYRAANVYHPVQRAPEKPSDE